MSYLQIGNLNKGLEPTLFLNTQNFFQLWFLRKKTFEFHCIEILENILKIETKRHWFEPFTTFDKLCIDSHIFFWLMKILNWPIKVVFWTYGNRNKNYTRSTCPTKILLLKVCKMTLDKFLHPLTKRHLQLPTFAYNRLLNKPYENEVTLRGQNPPLKCF